MGEGAKNQMMSKRNSQDIENRCLLNKDAFLLLKLFFTKAKISSKFIIYSSPWTQTLKQSFLLQDISKFSKIVYFTHPKQFKINPVLLCSLVKVVQCDLQIAIYSQFPQNGLNIQKTVKHKHVQILESKTGARNKLYVLLFFAKINND